MAPPKQSWASVASAGISSNPATPASSNPGTAPAIARLLPDQATPAPLIAFISGHIDITPAQFSAQYDAALDAAIHRGDAFIISNARGADTLALAYLRAHDVHPSRITVYLHTPRPNQRPRPTLPSVDKARPGPQLEDRYRKEGYSVRVIKGYHTERDAAMTDASDYDILWVRDEVETAALYGSKYRPGRISGTQKNKDRRVPKESTRTASTS